MASLDRLASLDEGELRLKIATQRQVRAVHGTQLAGEIAGCRQQRISDCQVTNTRDFLRLDEVQRLEDASKGTPDWPVITRAQARHHGFALLPLIGADCDAGTTQWHAAIARVSRESGEAVARACKIVGDGEVTGDEVRSEQLLEEIDQAIGSLAEMRALAAAAVRERG